MCCVSAPFVSPLGDIATRSLYYCMIAEVPSSAFSGKGLKTTSVITTISGVLKFFAALFAASCFAAVHKEQQGIAIAAAFP